MSKLAIAPVVELILLVSGIIANPKKETKKLVLLAKTLEPKFRIDLAKDVSILNLKVESFLFKFPV